MKNRREKKAVRHRDYFAASWYAANHYFRLGIWALVQVSLGRTVDFS